MKALLSIFVVAVAAFSFSCANKASKPAEADSTTVVVTEEVCACDSTGNCVCAEECACEKAADVAAE